jgi:hypothetical protein
MVSYELPGAPRSLWLDGPEVADVGASRDPDGSLHTVSPVCTHLGCRVRGTAPSGRGTARATARASLPTGGCCKDPPCAHWNDDMRVRHPDCAPHRPSLRQVSGRQPQLTASLMASASDARRTVSTCSR